MRRSIRIIGAIAWRDLLVLSRMPAILLVIFVPGPVMYLVFSLIFEGPAARPFRAGVIDEDGTEASRALVAALERSNVTVIRTRDETAGGPALTAEDARAEIRRRGHYRVAVVIPRGYGDAPNATFGTRHSGVELLYDETQRMEADAIIGMIQMAAGRALFEKLGLVMPGANADGAATRPAGGDEGAAGMLVRVKKTGVAIRRAQVSAKHTFLAAIVPMFLLFGATSAGRNLLEALQSGEIVRMLAAPISPAHLVVGSMASTIAVALVQCYTMYVFAWLVFGVTIWSFAGELALVTIITCLACTGFGILLGALCRNSLQMDSIGTVVILAMSAIGGSMVPRFVMPAFMQKLGLFTINGWAHDGLMGLLLGSSLAELWQECAVLLAVAAVTTAAGSILLGRRLRSGVRK